MLTSEQIRAARALLRIEQRDLAERAGVSLETIKRLERLPGPISAYTSTVDAIRHALEKAGVEFIDQNGGGPGARLKNPIAPTAAEPASASKRSEGTKGAAPKSTRKKR
jgi:transcriptional regulator with XRE-family HTH domain